MGKTIILVRHAKSDWVNINLSDFDRPLNKRGKKDAPEMAQRLLNKKVQVDAIVSSPAVRAANTASVFAEALQVKITYNEELYMAAPEIFNKVISSLNNEWNTVLIVSHNNGITDFANILTNARIDNMPTCGVFAVQAGCLSWNTFKDTTKEFLFFDCPKNL